MLKILRRLIGENIDLVWQPGFGLSPIKIDPSQIDQILANLCVNARDAIEGVGRVTIDTRDAILDKVFCDENPGAVPGDYVLMAVSDNGRGMYKDTLVNVFEPFFTTKDVGKGTGLGLATVYGIVKQNNGFINVASKPGEGTSFKIYLPRHLAAMDRVPKETITYTVPRGSETLLLVEDEVVILEMTKLMLESLGYTVLAASSPSNPVDFAKEYIEEIHLLITDVIMPGMNGYALAQTVAESHPTMKLLFMSGYMGSGISGHTTLSENDNFIHKPFSLNVLATKVREVLDGLSISQHYSRTPNNNS